MRTNTEQTTLPEAPRVAAFARLSERNPHLWLLDVPVCPWCPRRHQHGGGDGEQPFGGHRLSHCKKWEGAPGFERGYYLVILPGEAPPKPAARRGRPRRFRPPAGAAAESPTE